MGRNARDTLNIAVNMQSNRFDGSKIKKESGGSRMTNQRRKDWKTEEAHRDVEETARDTWIIV